MPPDFAAWYAALGLSPGASDADIVRAKRAYNELYHADRLAHMSATARGIAEEKVKAANEAAQSLLDPALRRRRDDWAAAGGRGPASESARAGAEAPPSRGSPQAAGSDSRPPTTAPRRHRRPGRALLLALAAAAGGLLGTVAFLVHEPPPGAGPVPEAAEALPSTQPEPAPAKAERRTSPSRRLQAVTDSLIELPPDGRWSPPVSAADGAFRGGVFPEGPGANVRLRANGREIRVLQDAPAFALAAQPEAWELATLTGAPARVRFSRWPANVPAGTTIHITTVAVAAGAWSSRVWLGPFGITWEPDRNATYEARDDRGRTFTIPPTVRSVVADPVPQWLQFRSLDGQPMRWSVRYATR